MVVKIVFINFVIYAIIIYVKFVNICIIKKNRTSYCECRYCYDCREDITCADCDNVGCIDCYTCICDNCNYPPICGSCVGRVRCSCYSDY